MLNIELSQEEGKIRELTGKEFAGDHIGHIINVVLLHNGTMLFYYTILRLKSDIP